MLDNIAETSADPRLSPGIRLPGDLDKEQQWGTALRGVTLDTEMQAPSYRLGGELRLDVHAPLEA